MPLGYPNILQAAVRCRSDGLDKNCPQALQGYARSGLASTEGCVHALPPVYQLTTSALEELNASLQFELEGRAGSAFWAVFLATFFQFLYVLANILVPAEARSSLEPLLKADKTLITLPPKHSRY